MKQEEIIEGNKLIDIFMGFRVYDTIWECVNKNEQTGHVSVRTNAVLKLSDFKTNEFFGGKWEKFFKTKDIPTGCFIDRGFNGNLQYHTSWDWLMPVVEKISKIHSIDKLYVEYEKVCDALMLINIIHLWESVIKFINWYNNHTTTKP